MPNKITNENRIKNVFLPRVHTFKVALSCIFMVANRWIYLPHIINFRVIYICICPSWRRVLVCGPWTIIHHFLTRCTTCISTILIFKRYLLATLLVLAVYSKALVRASSHNVSYVVKVYFYVKIEYGNISRRTNVPLSD